MRTDVVLTVTGASFASGAHVLYGGVERTDTIFVSSTQLMLPLTFSDMASAGTVNIGVKNPAPVGGTTSTTQSLTFQTETTDPSVIITGADDA